MDFHQNGKKSGFQLLIVLVICFICSLATSTTLTVDVTLGEEVTVECKSSKAKSLFWTAHDGSVITSKPCKTCNIKSEMQDDQGIEAISLLKMVPFFEKDFSEYKCHGVTPNGVKVLNRVLVNEKKTKEELKCRKALVRAQFLSEGRENPPLCEKDGTFKRVQVRKENGRTRFRCVDQKTGEKQGIESADIYELECTATKISIPMSIGILAGIQALIIIFDLTLYFTCKEGIIAHFLKKRKRQNYMPLRTGPKRQRVASIAPKHNITSFDDNDDDDQI